MKKGIIILLIAMLVVTLPAGTARADTWPNAYETGSNTADSNQILCSIGDVNGDGIRDIVAGCEGSETLPRLVVISGGYGTKIWDSKDTGSSNPGDAVLSVAAIGDVNDDEIPDVLAGSADNCVYCYDGSDGTLLWEYEASANVTSVAAIGDSNNDGIPDALAGSADGNVYYLNGTDGTELWMEDWGDLVVCVAAINDVDGDGKQDVVIGERYDCEPYKCGAVVCLSGDNGNLFWSWDGHGWVQALAAIDDVNGDGKQDVLATSGYHVSCIEGDASLEGEEVSELWDKAFVDWAPDYSVVLAIDDVNNDEIPDVLTGGDTWMTCFSGSDGDVLLLYFALQHVFSMAAIGDVNGDGIPDFLAGSADNGTIYCLTADPDAEDEERVLWEYETSDVVRCVASLGQDVNGDGYHEAICINASGFVYGFSGSAGSPVPPVPELPTVILLSTGLIALGACLWLKRPKKVIGRTSETLPQHI